MGGFRKIFVKSEEQFQDYRKFYDFAEELYISQNRLFGVSADFSCHYYIPFLKDPQESSRKRKDKREKSLMTSQKE